MVQRKFWLDRIKKAWQKRSVLWLSGVRRAGKTFICQSLPKTEYFDCELPRVRRMMEDPDAFLEDLRGRTVVLDEVHKPLV
ncbi:MAG TPA: AAA family ATPase [Nitrospiria bacterium]|nr:AAA family ATPase [Nitrospiria bacterium]